MKNTIYTKWGSDIIAVSADWAQASWPVEGDARGRQVSDFGHSATDALEAALRDCSCIEGLNQDEEERLVAQAIATAVHESRYRPDLHERE